LIDLKLDEVLADETISTAYDWLCERRKDYPESADIWSFRRNWERQRQALIEQVRAGAYRFQLLTRVTLKSGEEIDLWSTRDALLLKCLALVLLKHLPCSSRCFHTSSTSGEKKGVKAALRTTFARLAENHFVLKTDVKSYYASIDHQTICDRLAPFIQDRRLWLLLLQYLKRCAERGGLFWEFHRGIALGCPLSPVLGGFFLHELDVRFEKTGSRSHALETAVGGKDPEPNVRHFAAGKAA
jgi:RNA-directed DNA polymerase